MFKNMTSANGGKEQLSSIQDVHCDLLQLSLILKNGQFTEIALFRIHFISQACLFFFDMHKNIYS